MKVGYQTISWGRTLSDGGKEMIKTIGDAGYDGVEIAQHPDEFSSATVLYELLRDAKPKPLKLLGLAGGSVGERTTFLEQLVEAENKDLVNRKGKVDKVIRFDYEYPYIYIDTWDDEYSISVVGKRWKFALHPHMFKPIQTASEAMEVLKKHPELCFLPDTAHLTIAGEDVVKVLEDSFQLPILDKESGERVERKFGPVIAVHLKDWTSEFGRSYQFYSRGFGVRFGLGEVKLDKILRFLEDQRYTGWLVVEQDVVEDPVGAPRSCFSWLRDRGF